MNRFIMADAEKCIGCRTCEVACAVAHQDDFTAEAFTSRLRVVKGDAYTTAVGCHQCEDAPCANVCPTGSLRIANNCVELCEEICIGCKLCTIACPYGAINIDAEFPPSILEEVERNLEAGCISGLKSIAIKCDLCAGIETGPACVSSCPTGALVMIDPVLGECKFGKKIKHYI